MSVVAIVIQILSLAWPPDKEPLKAGSPSNVISVEVYKESERGYGGSAAGGARARRCHARIVERYRDVVRVKEMRINKSDHGLLCW
jgi:hypothetical protein